MLASLRWRRVLPRHYKYIISYIYTHKFIYVVDHVCVKINKVDCVFANFDDVNTQACSNVFAHIFT